MSYDHPKQQWHIRYLLVPWHIAWKHSESRKDQDLSIKELARQAALYANQAVAQRWEIGVETLFTEGIVKPAKKLDWLGVEEAKVILLQEYE